MSSVDHVMGGIPDDRLVEIPDLYLHLAFCAGNRANITYVTVSADGRQLEVPVRLNT